MVVLAVEQNLFKHVPDCFTVFTEAHRDMWEIVCDAVPMVSMFHFTQTTRVKAHPMPGKGMTD